MYVINTLSYKISIDTPPCLFLEISKVIDSGHINNPYLIFLFHLSSKVIFINDLAIDRSRTSDGTTP